jgi:cyclase
MLKKRIIACLDVKNNHVIKGVKFQQHEIVGDILTLAKKYNDAGIDELVFYDITASCEKRIVDKN